MPKKGLNLIRPQIAPLTLWDQAYKWVLTAARIILILIEVVVIFTFIIRIVVDTQGRDLDKDVSSIDNQLAEYTNAEVTFRKTQEKTTAYDQLWTQSSDYTVYARYINNLIRNETGEITVQMSKTLITISGSIPLQSVRVIEQSMKNAVNSTDPNNPIRFKKVELVDVDSSAGNEASFSIRAELIPTLEKRDLIE